MFFDQVSGDTWHDYVNAPWNPREVTHDMSHVVHLCEWLTLSQVEELMGKQNKKRKEVKKIMEMTCSKGGKWWVVSPTWTIRWIIKNKKKERGKKEGENEQKR